MLPKHCEREVTANERTALPNANANRLGVCLDTSLAVIMLLVFMIRLLTLNVPLERDEGEFAYGAQLLLAGVPPWIGLYSLKLSGIYAAYSLVMSVSGQSHFGIHLGLAVVNALATCVVFFLGKELFDARSGLVAATAYAVLSLSPGVLGIMGHATHFVVLFALLGMHLLFKSTRSPLSGFLLSCAGSLMGIAVTMKQHGGAFVLFGMTYLVTSAVWRRSRLGAAAKDITLFAIGAALPICLLLLFVWQTDALEQFCLWTFSYAGAYASHTPGDLLKWIPVQFKQAASTTESIWILGSVGLVWCLCMRETRRQGVLLLELAIFSLLAVSVGFYFRRHYFVMLLPAVSLCAGGFVLCSGLLVKQISKRRIIQFVPVLIVVLGLGISVHGEASFYLRNTPEGLSRQLYGGNPFVESVAIGQYIRKHSKDGDRVAILGSEPEILFYSGRRSATGFVYMYPLMEKHEWALPMQMEMAREIESTEPRFLVLVNMPVSWLRRSTSESWIFKWLKRVEKAGTYQQVGLVEFVSDTASVSYWGQESQDKKPKGPWWIKILEKK